MKGKAIDELGILIERATLSYEDLTGKARPQQTSIPKTCLLCQADIKQLRVRHMIFHAECGVQQRNFSVRARVCSFCIRRFNMKELQHR